MTNPLRVEIKCRCCGAVPLVGYFGLCAECADAVERLLQSRKHNASPEAQAKRAAWRGANT